MVMVVVGVLAVEHEEGRLDDVVHVRGHEAKPRLGGVLQLTRAHQASVLAKR